MSWVVDMEKWVVGMEKKLDDAEPPAKAERWPKHCIFRVPLRFKFKMVDGRANIVYKPQTVSLGPFHHDDEELKPMEEHKLRAVRHLLHRDSCKTTVAELFATVEKVADELADAYMDLGDEWRGEENRGKFLEMMITDGCFLLEVMRDSIPKYYAPGDPVFSWHGIQHIRPFVQRDMLLIENQLPLRLLEKIVAAESGTSPSAASINSMVLKFLERKDTPEGSDKLGLHPLDIYRTSLLKKTVKIRYRSVEMDDAVARPQRKNVHRGVEMDDAVARQQKVVPRSAWKLSEAAGIQFLPSKTTCLDDIYLDKGRLYMPRVKLDDYTAYRLHNLMVFEAMHVSTGNDVTAYVLFVKDLVDSAADVRLLVRKRVLEHDLADDDAVVRLFNGLTRDVSKNWESQLCHVREAVEHNYRRTSCVRVFLYESWANLRSKYFRSPWTLLALVTAILLVVVPLVGDIAQTVFAVISYELNKGNPKMN